MTQNLYTQEALRMVLHKLIEEKKSPTSQVASSASNLPSSYLSPSTFQEAKQVVDNKEDINSLKAVVRELVHRQELLKKEFQEKEIQNFTEYKQKLKLLEDENKHLKENVVVDHSHYLSSQEQTIQNTTLVRERDHYKRLLNEQQKTVRQLEEVLKQKENDSLNKEDRHYEFETKIQLLQKEIEFLKIEKIRIENETTLLKEEKLALVKSLDEVKQQHAILTHEFALRLENFEPITQENKQLKEAHINNQQQYVDIQKELEQAQRIIFDTANSKTRLEEQYSQLEERLKEQRTLFDTMNMTTKALEKELDSHKIYKAELEKHLEIRIESCIQLEERNELLEKQLIEQNRQFETQLSELHEQENVVQKLEEEHQRALHQLESSQKESIHLRTLISEQAQSLKQLMQIEERVRASFGYMQKAFSILYPDPESTNNTPHA